MFKVSLAQTCGNFKHRHALQADKIMNKLIQFFLAAIFTACCLTPAQAEKVTLRICGESMSVIKKPCVEKDELVGAISPVQAEFTYSIATFRARISEFERGSRAGDPQEPGNHDRVALLAYSGDGQTLASQPWRLSTYYLYQVVHDFDGANDALWLFSNRHELADVDFGSAEHRQLIYSLVDVDGSMGLALSAPRVQGDIREGALTGHILNGQPEHESLYTKWTTSQADPWRFSYMALNRLSAETIARARKYPIYAPGFDQQVMNAIGLMCSLSRVEPALAQSSLFEAATRAKDLGMRCRQRLYHLIFEAMHREQEHFERQEGKALPVSRQEVLVALLELLATDTTFRIHPDAQPVIGESVYTSSFRGEGVNFMRILPELIFGPRLVSAIRDFSNNEEISSAARKLMEKYSYPVSGEDTMEAQFLELDRRFFRRDLVHLIDKYMREYDDNVEALWAVPQMVFASGLLCRRGWGLAEDVTPWLDKYHDRVRSDNAETRGSLVGLVLASADDDIRQSILKSNEELEERRNELRKRDDAATNEELALLNRFFESLNYIDSGSLCS
jgi:hypothetical protein